MRLHPFLLLLAALLPLPARAATLDTFTITGTQSNNSPFSLVFQFPSSISGVSLYTSSVFYGVPILVNGIANETGSVTIVPGAQFQGVSVGGQYLFIDLDNPNDDSFRILTTQPFGSVTQAPFAPRIETFLTSPTNQATTDINCYPPLYPYTRPSLFPKSCSAVSNLAISSATTTVTPEPSSFALLLLGAAALAGTLYTRVLRFTL